MNDVGIIPELFCRECQVYIKPVVHIAEDGSSKGFWIRHPTNNCKHSNRETVMPIITLAQICLKL